MSRVNAATLICRQHSHPVPYQFPTIVSLYPVVTRTVVPAGCTSFRQIAWLFTTG